MFMNSKMITCVVPARNEAGRLPELIDEICKIDYIDEILIVEGNSEDNTKEVAKLISAKNPKVSLYIQNGRGKFDAVRMGVLAGKNDLVLIWDADGTVNTLDTMRIVDQAINRNVPSMGNRLKGKIHPGAMRKANFFGNWAFSIIWAPFLGFKLMDLLCGTKIFRKQDFIEIPDWVLNSDPYGDFTLIASAIIHNHGICSIPVDYFPRAYGETNIRRWSGGLRLIYCSFICFIWILISKFRRIFKCTTVS